MSTIEIPHEIIEAPSGGFVCLKVFGGLAFFGADLEDAKKGLDNYLRKTVAASSQSFRIEVLQRQIKAFEQLRQEHLDAGMNSDLSPAESAKYGQAALRYARLAKKARKELSLITNNPDQGATP